MLRCLRCGKKGKFVNFKFNCGDHNYKECSAQGVAHSEAVKAQTVKEESQQRFIAKVAQAFMKQCMDGGEEYEGETRYKGGNEKGKRGINLDGEESNEPQFQKVEEPPEEDEEDTDQHKHIDKLLEETLECLLEMKKKSNKINVFINKSKELMIAMHDYIIYNHIYWYKNDYDEHGNKVKEILTVCEELQMKGYSSNLFFFIRNILNPHTQNNEDDYVKYRYSI
jgi:ferritin